MSVEILACGTDWIAVDKPNGVMVHRSKLSRDRDVMLTRLRDHVGHWVYPVHRLDRGTSGCLVFGLSPDGARRMQAALQNGRKQYLTLVRGQASKHHQTTVDRPLRAEKGKPEKEAQTDVEVLKTWADPRCSFIRATPHTGRFHQIRRHLAGLSHPVLGDSSHGDSKVNRAWRERGLARLFLHCTRMELPHEDGPISLRSPLPPALFDVLAELPGSFPDDVPTF